MAGFITDAEKQTLLGRLTTAVLAAPVQANTATSTSGGTLPAATYFYVVTAVNARGETVASNEKSQVTTGSTSSNTISWAAVPGATAYRVYRSTTTNTELKLNIADVTTTSLLDTNFSTAAQPSPPTVNTTAGGVFLGLAVAIPDDGAITLANITEVTTSGYARKAITWGTPSVVAPIQIKNTTDITFGPVAADMPNAPYTFATNVLTGTVGQVCYVWQNPGTVAALNGKSVLVPANALVIE